MYIFLTCHWTLASSIYEARDEKSKNHWLRELFKYEKITFENLQIMGGYEKTTLKKIVMSKINWCESYL